MDTGAARARGTELGSGGSGFRVFTAADMHSGGGGQLRLWVGGGLAQGLNSSNMPDGSFL